MVALAFSEAKVVAPVDEPTIAKVLLLKVCFAVQALALARLIDATTAPVVGEMVNVLSLLLTDETAAEPVQEPQVGAVEVAESKHWPAVAVPERIAKVEAVE